MNTVTRILVGGLCLVLCACAQEGLKPADHGLIGVSAGETFDGEAIALVETRPDIEVGYYENGRMAFRREIVDGLTDGVTLAWYPCGQLKYERRFAGGSRCGRSREFDDEGRLIEDGAWLAGVRIDCHDAGRDVPR